ncbi:hypothetical protein LR48_Vigan01g088400 [Vigna angularis]|uniref:Uncharacterized protein n=1 Tax=Phaseolus angularis TaxID=3914 RepID=A0A0L9TME3_PHAAN|nr:hypothetical protein LR48_Vigan01g088400 [Vigna angularis]
MRATSRLRQRRSLCLPLLGQPSGTRTIIRAVITDDWNERFKSTYVIPKDAIKKIRQELIAYLLQGWT